MSAEHALLKFHAYNLHSLNIACLIVFIFLALIPTDNTNVAFMVHHVHGKFTYSLCAGSRLNMKDILHSTGIGISDRAINKYPILYFYSNL